MRVVFVGQHRRIWTRLLLYLVTFGISRRIWLYKINKEIDGHAALGINHKRNAVLLVLPIVGPSIVTYETARRCNKDLHSSAPLAYGPTWGLWAATLVPILGNLFFIGWTQDRLNRYWAYERANPEGMGIDIDLDLAEDPGFVVEMQKAHARSYQAGSRFDNKKEARQEQWQRRRQYLGEVKVARQAYREMGGSTPILPWKAPQPEPLRKLSVTCGRCHHGFSVTQDPLAETVILCPECGLNEVIPALRSDPLADREPAVVPTVTADCPECNAHFFAKRNLEGKTALECPECGHKDTLPAPKRRKQPAKKKAAKTKTGSAQ